MITNSGNLNERNIVKFEDFKSGDIIKITVNDEISYIVKINDNLIYDFTSDNEIYKPEFPESYTLEKEFNPNPLMMETMIKALCLRIK